jgi:hypothetical protein
LVLPEAIFSIDKQKNESKSPAEISAEDFDSEIKQTHARKFRHLFS